MNTLLALTLLLAACSPDDGGGDTAEVADDTGGAGDDTGGAGGWEPAQITPGAYDMRVVSVVEHTCGGPLDPGYTEVVLAPFIGGYIQLWGFARTEQSGVHLRAAGVDEVPVPDVDCVVTDTIDAAGSISSPSEFILDVKRTKEGAGSGCASLPLQLPCSQEYSATFRVSTGGPDDTGEPHPDDTGEPHPDDTGLPPE